ncbi:hypothetical protein MMC30_001440 [Trapelia coarctata]|nr:hypothetical protein [Trapelia coarctata]
MDPGAQKEVEERMRGDTAGPDLSNLERGDKGAPETSSQAGLGTRFRTHFTEEVTNSHADILLILCCVISGFIDSAIYNAYSTFVSMQTGLGASGQPTTKPYGWARSLTSIGCFILGSFFFSRFCRYLGPLKRSTLVASFLLQSIIVFFCGAIVQSNVVDGSVQQPGGAIKWLEEIPIALLSFQSSGQMVGSRILSLSEIPTIVVTSVLCDFASDPDLMSSLTRNAKRNRRALAFLGILVGAVIGGWIEKVTDGLQTVIWIVGVIKVIVTVSWAFWPQKRPAATK